MFEWDLAKTIVLTEKNGYTNRTQINQLTKKELTISKLN